MNFISAAFLLIFLCFNIQILQPYERDGTVKVLYLFTTSVYYTKSDFNGE